jgi:hypothetical protein
MAFIEFVFFPLVKCRVKYVTENSHSLETGNKNLDLHEDVTKVLKNGFIGEY